MVVAGVTMNSKAEGKDEVTTSTIYGNPSLWTQKMQWALDNQQIKYNYMLYAKPIHRPYLQKVLGNDEVHVSVPFLVKNDGTGIMGSWPILQWVFSHYPEAKDKLFPDKYLDQIHEIDSKNDIICNYSRKELFSYIRDNPTEVTGFVLPQFLNSIVGPLSSFFIKQELNDQLSAYEKLPGAGDPEAVRKVVKENAAQLKKNGGKYLLGDSLTYADISLAVSYGFVKPKGFELPKGLPEKLYDDEFLQESQDILKYRDIIYGLHQKSNIN